MLRTVACAIRNTGSGWFVISDALHQPLGVSALSQDAQGITLTYDFVAAGIHTLGVTTDETFAGDTLRCGASVGVASAYLQLWRNGVLQNPSTVTGAFANLWVHGLFTDGGTSPPNEADDPNLPHSQIFVASGQFTVPSITSQLVVRMWGPAGGGHGDGSGAPGTDGGDTTIAALGLNAGGGKKGGTSAVGGGGLGGVASGGDVNVNGERGGNGVEASPSGKGGNAPYGGIGGAPATNATGLAGQAPGGGGSGGNNGVSISASGGGSGSYLRKTYSAGQLTPGTVLAVALGSLGLGGAGMRPGGDGARGEVRFFWD